MDDMPKWTAHPNATPQGRAWGKTLWERRKFLGITQTQAAALIGTSQVNYNRWERGVAVPRQEWQTAILYGLRFTDADRDRLAERLLPVRGVA